MVFLLLTLAVPAAFAQPVSTPPAEEAAGGPPAKEVLDEAEEASTPAEETITVGEAFVRKLAQGGLTMVFLGLASVAALASLIERLARQRRKFVVPAGLVARADALYRKGGYDKLIRECEAGRSTLDRMLVAITRHRAAGADRVSQIAGDIAARDLKRHLQCAYPPAVVATLSPLLGLLGTVIGMIGAFDTVAAMGALGDASQLGGDISKALVTTGAGLAIAIPSLAAYHWFKSRVQAYAIDLEELTSELIAGWFLEGDSQAPAGAAAASMQPTRDQPEADKKTNATPQTPQLVTAVTEKGDARAD